MSDATQPFGRTYHHRVAQPQSTEREAPDRLAAGVVLASGSGTRVGGELNKVYLPMAGRRVVGWSLVALSRVTGVLVLVIRPQDRALADEVLADPALAGIVVHITHGGASRQDSELMALRALADRIDSGAIDTVLIHDAARPLVTPDLAGAVLRAARETGGAIPGLPRHDLVRVDADGVVTDADLGRVVTVQTPQGYRAGPLLAAYEQAAADGFTGTDTAACMARYSGIPTRYLPGAADNMKITYPHDVAIAADLLARDTARHDVDGVRGVRLHR
jgi:2-C-methyl-D-erythritol 4-phosphate cytidylyltransferase